MFVMFSFHLSHRLVFRKSASVDNQPVSWLSIVGDKPPRNAVAETILLLFASSLFFNLGWAQLSCSCPLAGVACVVSWSPKDTGMAGLLSAGPRASPPCGGSQGPRQQGSWTAYMAAQSSRGCQAAMVRPS